MSYQLAEQVYASGFKPTYMAALWRGGTPVGVRVQEYLAIKEIKMDHIAPRTSRYTGIDKTSVDILVHGIGHLTRQMRHDDSLLIVDDVFDTGNTLVAFLGALQERMGRNLPLKENIKIATVYYKPSRNETELKPHYFVEETDEWIVFPHELEGLSEEEI
jgi:uncharacterized protein